ncbi:MAG: PAS domain S-box protein, partial [Gemmatimonadales bacterium]
MRRLLTPFGIAVIYAFCGAAWIFFSDRLLLILSNGELTAEQLSHEQTLKGFLFILVTALLVYGLVRAGQRVVQSSEAARQESESRYQQIFRDSSAAILVVDRESGRVLEANPSAIAFYGWPEKELVGMPIGRINAMQGEGPDRAWHQAAAEGHSFFVTRQRTASGVEREVAMDLTPIRIGGRPCLYCVIHDITERQHLGDILAASERRYRTLLAEASDPIFVAGADGTILEANTRACRLVGTARASILGQPLTGLLTREDPARSVTMDDLRSNRLQLVELRLRRADGTLLPVEVTSTGLEDGTVQAILRDVTERRAVETHLRQVQKMEAVGQLTGGIAHDLNNILTVVLAHADLIAQALPADRKELQEDIEELRNSCRRGAAMIRKLLSFSRSATLTFQTVDLGAHLRELSGTLRRLLPAGVEVRLELPAEPLLIRGDTLALEQIILNLATNARDAMQGTGLLVMSGRRQHLASSAAQPWITEGEYVRLEIRDTGLGMSDDVRARIFEPFFTTKPPAEGTGLGMAMVYGLVKQHEGSIEVDSVPGEGTAVTIYLPVWDESMVAPAPPVRAGDAPAALVRGRETILLVEDEEPLRRAARRLLEHLGYTVLLARDGEEALELFRRNQDRIDLVISDVIMPRVGGRALYEALQGERSRARFLFTSGYSRGDASAGGQAGLPDA